jgi:deoxycytidylate deaminase
VNLSKTHKAYFSAADAMSRLSNFDRIHIGAVAVYKHKIVSSGFNSTKTNPLQKKINKYRFADDTPHCLHAETSCLLPLMCRKDIDFSNVTLYTHRRYANGELGPSRPCKSCMSLIKSLGIKNIYYTNDGSYVHEEIVY